MGEGIRFLWNATRGDRLRPWRSPYLRWRLETYSGKRAESVRLADFLGAVLEREAAVVPISPVDGGDQRGYTDSKK